MNAPARTTPRVRHGESHPNAKLSDEELTAFRARLQAGESVDSLFPQFAISRSYAYKIASGQARRDTLPDGQLPEKKRSIARLGRRPHPRSNDKADAFLQSKAAEDGMTYAAYCRAWGFDDPEAEAQRENRRRTHELRLEPLRDAEGEEISEGESRAISRFAYGAWQADEASSAPEPGGLSRWRWDSIDRPGIAPNFGAQLLSGPTRDDAEARKHADRVVVDATWRSIQRVDRDRLNEMAEIIEWFRERHGFSDDSPLAYGLAG